MNHLTAREVSTDHWIVTAKKLGYLITFIPHLILPLVYFVWQEFSRI